MNDVIISGIINTQTGDITETVLSSEQNRSRRKTALRLKVRDELNKQHGPNAFMTFDFETSIGCDLSYIRKHMVSKEPALLQTLEQHRDRYMLVQATQRLASTEKTLATTREVLNECSALYQDNETKLFIIEEAMEEEIRTIEKSISSQKMDILWIQERLDGIRSRQ